MTKPSANILIVDDNEVMRAVTALLLEGEELGHIRAVDPATAIKVVDSGDRLDLVIIDVAMPGISGPELILRARQKHPNTPVIFISGHSLRVVEGYGLDLAKSRFLQKPFSRADLLRAIRITLADPMEGNCC